MSEIIPKIFEHFTRRGPESNKIIAEQDTILQVGGVNDEYLTWCFVPCNPIIFQSEDHKKYGILHYDACFMIRRQYSLSHFSDFTGGEMRYLINDKITIPSLLSRNLAEQYRIKSQTEIPFPFNENILKNDTDTFFHFDFTPLDNTVALSSYNRKSNASNQVILTAFLP